MPRKNAYTGRYKIDKNALGIVKYWSRSYWSWKERYKELEAEIEQGKALRYDKEQVQTSNQSDEVAELAVKLAILDEKIKKVYKRFVKFVKTSQNHLLNVLKV